LGELIADSHGGVKLGTAIAREGEVGKGQRKCEEEDEPALQDTRCSSMFKRGGQSGRLG
jgi:hypothetical protein